MIERNELATPPAANALVDKHSRGPRPGALPAPWLGGDQRVSQTIKRLCAVPLSVVLLQFYVPNAKAATACSNISYASAANYAVGSNPTSVAFSDVNGDGKPDLVSANYGSNNVSVLLGQGNGTFQPQVTYVVETRPYSVAISDVNGDGKQDLVTANYADNNVSVLLNNCTPVTPPDSTGPSVNVTAVINGNPKQVEVLLATLVPGWPQSSCCNLAILL